MKAILQLLGAILAAVLPVLIGDDPFTVTEWVNILLLAMGAGTVYIAGNLTGSVWQYTKTIMSGIQAGAVVLISALSDGGVSNNEWFQCVLALLSVWAVYQVPARKPEVRGRHRAEAS
jgi:hypothetical protein